MMKQVNTNLTERQFLSNLECSSRLKSRFDRNNDAIRFIYEIKGNKFWLGKYDPSIGRTGGFSSERLNCKYEIAENGYVMLAYRKARHPLHVVLLLLALAIGMYYCISSFINVFTKFEIEELIIALGFLVVGLYGLIIKPYKPMTKNAKAIINSSISNFVNTLIKEDIQ